VKEDDYIKGRGAQIKPHNPFDKNELVQEHWEGIDMVETDYGATKIQKIYPKQIVNRVDSPDLHFSWSMNPYQGCEHGCAYCYARNTHTYWGYDAGISFEKQLLVKMNAAELLKKKLRHKNWKGERIHLSGNTDCYQPIERKLEITRSLIDVAVFFNNPLGFITKNDLILRDFDPIVELHKNAGVRVAVSITTLDESLRRNLEPRTSTSKRRLEVVRQFADAGIPVQVLIAPVIPGLNQEEIPAIMEKAAKAGASDVSYLTLRLNGQVKDVFEDWLQKNYPNRVDKVMHQVASWHDGEVHDARFGRRMKGQGPHAASLAKLVEVLRRKYGFKSIKVD
jgi:DNA repair photolyase